MHEMVSTCTNYVGSAAARLKRGGKKSSQHIDVASNQDWGARTSPIPVLCWNKLTPFNLFSFVSRVFAALRLLLGQQPFR